MKRTYTHSGKYTKRAKAQRVRRAKERKEKKSLVLAPIKERSVIRELWQEFYADAWVWWKRNSPSVLLHAFGIVLTADLSDWEWRPQHSKGLLGGKFAWLIFTARKWS